MAKKKAETGSEDSVLEAAAKVIGKTAGKIAATVGIATPAKPKSTKIPKLAKKNKHRLPRRQKKAAKKAEQRQEAQ
ncbi:MAG TPA: hypothetical protein VHW24_21610 [Bryobacteraceae bacterium]|jgi:hypothetical protein|nr:hypothetical protein [Bryobacteraceae bacterium]